MTGTAYAPIAAVTVALRRALLRRRPEVTSWRQVLEAARIVHGQPRAG
ncbi:hypothetical protein OHB49_42750 (plasmid) [Streptomyces sp. NBC_01717]|nr:hypothetical protein [Streptomyces sp. NBC_01717]